MVHAWGSCARSIPVGSTMHEHEVVSQGVRVITTKVAQANAAGYPDVHMYVKHAGLTAFAQLLLKMPSSRRARALPDQVGACCFHSITSSLHARVTRPACVKELTHTAHCIYLSTRASLHTLRIRPLLCSAGLYSRSTSVVWNRTCVRRATHAHPLHEHRVAD